MVLRRVVVFVGVFGVIAASFVTAQVAQGVDAAATPTVSVTKLTDASFGFPDCTTLVSQHATFRFTRTDTTGSLDVSISTSGSAVAGQDYVAPASVTLPDGVATVDFALDGAPSQAFLIPARTTSVTVTVEAGSGYTVGTPASADATITYFVPPPCPPATFASSMVNVVQTVAPDQLPQPLLVDPAPPGATFIDFLPVAYPGDVPQSWYPPPGLSWAAQPPGRTFTWLWQLNNPPTSPVALPIGAHSFDVKVCAYYMPVALYYGLGPVDSHSCTTIKFSLNVEATPTNLPSFTG